MAQSWMDLLEPAPSVSRVQTLSYPEGNAPHLKDSGFSEHIASWDADLATVIQLTNLHSEEDLWSSGSLAHKSELCIGQIHCLAGVYLAEAEYHAIDFPFLRHAITGLHLSSNKFQIKFNAISKDSLSHYRTQITRLLALALRFWVIKLGKSQFKKGDHTRCKALAQKLGAFDLLLSENQTGVLQRFMEKVHRTTGALSNADVLQFIHEFLLKLLDNHCALRQGVSSIVEQSVLILCLSQGGKGIWRSATWLYSVISIFFRIARSTLVHAAFLGGRSAKYVQLPPGAIEGTMEDSRDELDEGNQLDESALIELQVEDSYEEPQDYLGGNEECLSESGHSVIRQLQALSSLIDPSDKTRVYGRLFYIRNSIQSIAKAEPFSSRAVWCGPNDGQVVISWAFMDKQDFCLLEIQHTTFVCVERLNDSLRQLFPVDLWDSFLSTLSIQSFVDDWEAKSMFHCPQNATLLAPAIEQLYNTLSKAIAAGTNALSSHLNRSQAFLSCLATALYLTTGIPPYAGQAVQLRYTGDDKFDRNFMLLDGTLGILLWRTGKGGNVGYGMKGSSSVWHTPPQVTLPLILYLGVFRPVEIRLVNKEASIIRKGLATAPLYTHIFCNPLWRASAKTIHWDPDQLDKVLRSGPTKMSAFPHRLLFTAIIEQKHASLLTDIGHPSVLDAQGQHTQSTSLKNYAVLPLQHSTGFHFSGFAKQLLVCQELHASCFLVKPIAKTNVNNSLTSQDIMSVIHPNLSYALNIARNAAAATHQLASSSSERAAVISRKAYSTVTLLSIISPQSELINQAQFTRDDICRVVHGLVGLDIHATAVDAYQNVIPQLTAVAATLMLASLSEWFTGSLKPYVGGISPLIGKWSVIVDSFTTEISLLEKFVSPNGVMSKPMEEKMSPV
ncbi:hypothetical protein BDQ12DRAFT_729560 [Crucibulum laeve]|uniref:Uncharacterized protein n=1 Tax=Crucibulum laeve TaxID=68775 RepID=A0A5C3LFD9_9AGAR|nr:hypothetical protein BDQ12DRAFT_729560 [Crucibulum laeve]